MSRDTVIEVLYPEFGNQAGDNGNVMYLKACLPDATFIETPFGAEPALATRDDISCLLVGCMTERQQERALDALMPWRDRGIDPLRRALGDGYELREPRFDPTVGPCLLLRGRIDGLRGEV